MSSPLRRIVTSHKDGKSIVLIEDELDPLPGFAASAATIWQSHRYLAELTDHDAAVLGGAKIYNKGSLIRVVDFPANSTGHNHRTTSLDYGIVLEGEIELVLDDASKTTVRAGDVVVQQATMHQWNNHTDKLCRMIFVLLPSEAATSSTGEKLQDYGVPRHLQADP